MISWVLKQLTPNLVADYATSGVVNMLGLVFGLALWGGFSAFRRHRSFLRKSSMTEPGYLIAIGAIGVMVFASMRL